MQYSSYCDHQGSNENEFSTVPAQNTVRRSTTKPSKQLPEHAVRLMNEWYAENEDNPYPNRNDLDKLATGGGIKESQVKAWFSNKRNRTQNTHPKRAKRYLVRNQNAFTQQNPSLWTNNHENEEQPQKIHVADDLERRAMLLQPQPYPNIQPNNWHWLPSSQTYDYYPSYPN